jgi:hypothetical protein
MSQGLYVSRQWTAVRLADTPAQHSIVFCPENNWMKEELGILL